MTDLEKRTVYKATVEEYLRQKFSIDRLEERFAEAGFTPMSADKGKNGQPKFIYLFNEPDLGRLSEEDAALFDELDAGAGEDAVFRFAQMAAATYQTP